MRYQNPQNYYIFYRTTGGTSQLRIARVVNGTETILKTIGIINPMKHTFFTLRAQANGNTLSIWLNGTKRAEVTDNTFASNGSIGINVRSAANNSTSWHSHRMDDIVVSSAAVLTREYTKPKQQTLGSPFKKK